MEPELTGAREARAQPEVRPRRVLRLWDLVLVFALPLGVLFFLARGCGGPPV